MAKKPDKYCGKDNYADDDGWTAYAACSATCETCGCEDSTTWLYKGKSGKDCEWVAKKPDKYCDKK